MAGPCEGPDCSDAVASLHEFIDGELTDDKRAAVQSHLDDCSGCYGAFGFEAELKAVVADRSVEQVPDDLRARIADQLGT